jgi:hypothetical protein
MHTIDIEAEKKEIQKRYRALLKACKPTMEKGDQLGVLSTEIDHQNGTRCRIHRDSLGRAARPN